MIVPSSSVNVQRGHGSIVKDVTRFAPSGRPGPKGNKETFAWLGEAGREGAIDDLAAAVAEVDA